MKKLVLLVAVVAAVTACKKDYTCECTTTVTGAGSQVNDYTIHDKKSDAKDACNQKASSSSSAGGATITCAIK